MGPTRGRYASAPTSPDEGCRLCFAARHRLPQVRDEFIRPDRATARAASSTTCPCPIRCSPKICWFAPSSGCECLRTTPSFAGAVADRPHFRIIAIRRSGAHPVAGFPSSRCRRVASPTTHRPPRVPTMAEFRRPTPAPRRRRRPACRARDVPCTRPRWSARELPERVPPQTVRALHRWAASGAGVATTEDRCALPHTPITPCS